MLFNDLHKILTAKGYEVKAIRELRHEARASKVIGDLRTYRNEAGDEVVVQNVDNDRRIYRRIDVTDL